MEQRGIELVGAAKFAHADCAFLATKALMRSISPLLPRWMCAREGAWCTVGHTTRGSILRAWRGRPKLGDFVASVAHAINRGNVRDLENRCRAAVVSTCVDAGPRSSRAICLPSTHRLRVKASPSSSPATSRSAQSWSQSCGDASRRQPRGRELKMGPSYLNELIKTVRSFARGSVKGGRPMGRAIDTAAVWSVGRPPGNLGILRGLLSLALGCPWALRRPSVGIRARSLRSTVLPPASDGSYRGRGGSRPSKVHTGTSVGRCGLRPPFLEPKRARPWPAQRCGAERIRGYSGPRICTTHWASL